MTLAEFEAIDPRRASASVDGYGSSWNQPNARKIRVMYVRDTDEVVAVKNEAFYLVMTTLPAEQVEHRLQGWAEVHEQYRDNSFEWVLDRLM